MVAYVRAFETNALFGQTLLHSHVGMVRSYGQITVQAAFVFKFYRDNIYYGVAVHKSAVFVRTQNAIGVAVEAETNIKLLLGYDSAYHFGIKRARMFVDTLSVAFGVYRRYFGAELGKYARRAHACRLLQPVFFHQQSL